MKNHYVSQFIIKKFSNTINVFDLKNGCISKNKRPNNAFYKKDIYDEEIEKLCNFNIESKVANILNNKILVDGKVVLTREDLNILKKYMLICSVRTQSDNQVSDLLKSFEHNADAYIETLHEYENLPKTKDLYISNHDLFFRILKVFASASDIRSIALNPLATREMICWALPYLESYITFWDAPENREFVLTDCGMCSEYEGFHRITGGYDISKFSYLLHQVKNGKGEYVPFLASNYLMYENYNVFNLSSKRCMIAINPFFKLYQSEKLTFKQFDTGEVSETLPHPDIWPAIIQSKHLFEIPTNEYSNSMYPLSPFAPDDKFIYEPKVLSEEDIIYINNLILSQSNEIIGFNDITKIYDSLFYHLWYSSNFESVETYKDNSMDIANKLLDKIAKSPYRKLIKFGFQTGAKPQIDFMALFEKQINYIYKDFKDNPYLTEYLLSKENEILYDHRLDFLGEGYKKIIFLQNNLKRIKEKKR